MGFLSPWLLGGLAAIGLPVIIHLLNKFRTRHTDWAAMRFLTDVVQQNQRRVKMDDLILLVLRCLLVAMAVLAFAGPVMRGAARGDGHGSGPIAAVVILDASASMTQADGAISRFDQAKQDIRAWQEKLDPQSSLALYLAATRPAALIAKPEDDIALFRKSLDEARVGDEGSDLLGALRLAVTALDGANDRPKDIHIYTDGQATAFRQRPELKKLAQEHPEITIRPFVIGTPVDNLGVVQLRIEGGVPAVGQPSRFHAEVMNSGAATVRGVRVEFLLDDGAPAGSAVIPAIAPGETQGVNVTVEFPGAGPHRITAVLPSDGFEADNRRVAAVDVANRMEVILAESDAAPLDEARAGFFLAHALTPVPKEQASRYYLAPVSLRLAELPSALAKPPAQRPAAVFLCDPGNLTAPVLAALDAYVKDGGNLAVFPGNNGDPVGWASQDAFAKMLPASLGAAVTADANHPPIAWQANGFTHPVTTLWNDPANGNLGTVKFAHYFPLSPKKDARVIANFADGTPSVAEWTYGLGTVALFSAGETQDATNHPLHPSFVPFFQRLMGYFNRCNESKLVLSPGEVFRKTVDESLRGKDFTLQRPGADAARTAGQVSGDGSGNGAVLRYAATDRAGAYQIAVANEPVAVFSVQLDPTESDLRAVEPAALTDLSEVSRDNAAAPGARLVILKEYWPALIWCVAALFVAEAALAHRISHAR
ncbi:BatA domain-containing protein [Luteolibacter ambystomatis]|uniref:BatA domain-containing protein n=1 Tax=Luteolibacter ambystomatis TaxID=2824561 RepID=A0A975PFA3_9BACT|nr:BatA domain-containing protein [Luteolibacter ambystomatis]QUE51908.1 BatA domain-containing protein [Luteolibacter ambystomatis]